MAHRERQTTGDFGSINPNPYPLLERHVSTRAVLGLEGEAGKTLLDQSVQKSWYCSEWLWSGKPSRFYFVS